ncbi:hypothetical protein D915_000314 [Fasciola hepatica]|uniref:CBS domain-containing protein n=1 Tax=Fasciola hepatica TaxID=6192 RepID=A0A4E0S3G0_FASHE|nr:hypothetical protein D915_000314 [Fasciola hepatica]
MRKRAKQDLPHSPLVCDCRDSRIRGYSTQAVHEHPRRLSSQYSPADRMQHMEQCTLDSASGPPSGDSSGFGDIDGRLDFTRSDPSPTFSSSFSPGHDSPPLSYNEQHSSNYCSSPTELVRNSAPSGVPPAVPPRPPTCRLSTSVIPETMKFLCNISSMPEPPRRQSSPGHPVPLRLASVDPRATGLANSFNKMNLRSRCRPSNKVCTVDAHNRSLPGANHPLPSLEPIPQGQELSVQSNSATLSPDSPNSARQSSRGGAPSTESDRSFPLLNGSVKKKSPPCCSCRVDDLANCTTTNHPNADTNGGRSMDFKSNSLTLSMLKSDKNTNSVGNSDSVHTAPDPVAHRSSDPSPRVDRSSQLTNIPGAHWAKELIGRLRSNSTHQQHPVHQSVDQVALHHIQHPPRQRRHSAPRDADPRVLDPDSIDPRRLPKSHGPTSARLQFSKTPLTHVPTSSSSTPTPIHVDMSPRNSLLGGMSAASSALKSASWRPRKHIGRVRWKFRFLFEEYTSVFRGRCQPFPSTTNTTRLSIRVKRASESERLLVVSRSLSDFHFAPPDFYPPLSYVDPNASDENHVYGTLFRHSTCYDVLPDSGKLVVLDSKLGVVRAIHALLENGVQAAPIWHAATQRVTGLFSQDFALHLLASLYNYGSVTDQGDQSSNSSLMSDSLDQPAVDFGLFYPPEYANSSPEFADSALIVPPQMGLIKALCRLVHKSHSHRIHGRRRSNDLIQNSVTGQTNNIQLRKQPPVRNDKPVRQDSVDLSDWEFPDPSTGFNPEGSDCDFHSPGFGQHQRRVSDPHVGDRVNISGRRCSGPPSANSSSSPLHCGPVGSHTVSYSPTHLIVMNPECGNVLGLIGVDRLLAYLRLRLDELPYSNSVMSPVGCLPSLRWSERSVVEIPQSVTSGSPSVTCDDPLPNIGQLPNPVLSHQTPCSEALRTLDLWLPQTPALPVVQSSLGATSVHAQTFLGFIAPGDLLNFVLGSELADVALDQPVSKILETKVHHCRFHQDCICYTEEPVVTVLDRMFRLKVTCLVLFDTPIHSSSPQLVGMVTAKDLLQAIVTTDPHHRRRRHPHLSEHQHRHSGSSQLGRRSDEASLPHRNEPMLLDDESKADADISDVVDPCAHALGLTHDQHIRLQQTQSDLLLGLSNPNSCSRSSTSSSSSSLSSGTTFSAGCGSASELEPESDQQCLDSSKQDVNYPECDRMDENDDNNDDDNVAGSLPVGSDSHMQHQNHRRSSSPFLFDRCSCACHQSGLAARIQPVAHSSESVEVSPVSAQSHSTKTGLLGHKTRPVPYPPKFDLVGNPKPNLWAIRPPHMPQSSLNQSRSPNSHSAASAVSAPTVRIPITGPSPALKTTFNSRKRRSETSSKKIPKREEDDSVFRMD